MPIPESDEEIMASWSPQEWGFHAWEERNSEKILETQSRDAGWDAHSKLIKHAWPDPDDRRKYLERTYFPDFLDMDKVDRLSLNISIYPKPFVAIGETNFGHVFGSYTFTPMTDSLEPKYPDSDSDVLGNMILALNIPLPQSPPLSPGSFVHLSDTDSDSNSSVSTELSHSFPSSTANNTPDSAASIVDLQTLSGVRLDFSNSPSSFNAIHRKGGHLMATIPSATGDMHANTFDSCPQDFVFAQLGLLWTFTGDWKKALHRNPNDDKRGRWNPTGFAVVVRLNPKGELGKVYALRHPDVVPQLERIEDDLIESRKPKANKKTAHKRGLYILKHYKPGHPHPKSDSSFSIAKIANSILELGSYKRQFDFEVLLSNEPQIVNAKMWVHGLDGPALMPKNKVANVCTQAKESGRDGSSTDQPDAADDEEPDDEEPDDEESSLFRGNPEKRKHVKQLEAFSETLAKFTTISELFLSAAKVSGRWTAFTFDEDGGDNEDGNGNGTNKEDVANPPGLEFALGGITNKLTNAAPSTLVVWEQLMIPLGNTGDLIGLGLYTKSTFFGLCDVITDAKTQSVGFDARNSTPNKKHTRGHDRARVLESLQRTTRSIWQSLPALGLPVTEDACEEHPVPLCSLSHPPNNLT
ncbi:uncharacterized protein FFE2_12466 [Fusarium fujikuroi]|nr:uncharacterized protein FFE2_12466 [Fusarium fujikuroi]SCO20291.1 uncharacterized protein FFM5_12358 [Fusarium fujikuroi]